MVSEATARPAWWPHFSSTVRSTALTARLGRALGIAFAICFLTGLLSYTQYLTWAWLPKPVVPTWGYRLTQGIHVITGVASIPLVLVKLWSVYPTSFRWPLFPSVKRVLEIAQCRDLGRGRPRPAGHRLPQPARLAAVPLGLRRRALRVGVRGHRRGPAARGDQAPGHPLRPRHPTGRRRRVDRDPLGPEPGLAQQRRPATATGDAGDLPARCAGGHRHRDRVGGDHESRVRPFARSSHSGCWPCGNPARDRRGCRSGAPPRRRASPTSSPRPTGD